jgi:hypothetical protein
MLPKSFNKALKLLSFFLHTGADWGQKASAGIGFIKAIEIADKASIPLKMCLKSLAILEKAFISLKKLSKIIEIF